MNTAGRGMREAGAIGVVAGLLAMQGSGDGEQTAPGTALSMYIALFAFKAPCRLQLINQARTLNTDVISPQ